MLALMGAMEEEVTLLHDEMTITDQAVHAGITVYRGTFKGIELALTQCGIGKVNATICTQMLVDLYKPDALVFFGVAGELLPNMQVGDPVIASHLIQYDMDLTAFGRRHGEILGQDRMVEAAPKLVEKCTDAFDAAFEDQSDGPNLMLGTVVSGDKLYPTPRPCAGCSGNSLPLRRKWKAPRLATPAT